MWDWVARHAQRGSFHATYVDYQSLPTVGCSLSPMHFEEYSAAVDNLERE
jgi:hypothetical protein